MHFIYCTCYTIAETYLPYKKCIIFLFLPSLKCNLFCIFAMYHMGHYRLDQVSNKNNYKNTFLANFSPASETKCLIKRLYCCTGSQSQLYCQYCHIYRHTENWNCITLRPWVHTANTKTLQEQVTDVYIKQLVVYWSI